MKQTHNTMIVDYKERFGSITTLQAVQDIGCLRLASRISELKKMGYEIGSELIKVPNRYGTKTTVKRYWLISKPKEVAA